MIPEDKITDLLCTTSKLEERISSIEKMLADLKDSQNKLLWTIFGLLSTSVLSLILLLVKKGG